MRKKKNKAKTRVDSGVAGKNGLGSAEEHTTHIAARQLREGETS